MAPRVSVVIPAYNEAAHIESCLLSALSQRVEGGIDVLVVDGGSSDGTEELARRLGARVVPNPAQSTASALNRALEEVSTEVFLRLDAHSEMSSGYIECCLLALEQENGAVNVGGWCEVRGGGRWAEALGAVLASPLGVGNPRHWRRPRGGAGRVDVESVPFGCFRTEALRAAGGWSERLNANEDFELNHRLRRAGGRIVFDPLIRAIYHPRESLGAIARQYSRHGFNRALALSDAPGSLRPRQLAPPALVVGAALAAGSGRLGRAARVGLGVYCGAICAEAARSRAGWRTAPVLSTVHLSWGGGLVAGLLAALVRRVSGSAGKSYGRAVERTFAGKGV